MSLVDSYIKVRERSLDWILGTSINSSLNPVSRGDPPYSPGTNLAREIKSSLNQFKVSAMDQEGRYVDYQQLSRSPEFKNYCDLVSQLEDFKYQTLKTKQDKLAFWINLYNSLVIHAVIQEGVKTIVTESWLGILSFFQQAAYTVAGQRFSLTDIEHGVLRGNRGFPYFPGPHFAPDDPRQESVIDEMDPRIHFTLNCASNSCPPIGVYSPEALESQLDLASRNFIQGDILLNKESKMITISRIFRWYLVDFGGRYGVLEFLINHLDDHQDQGWLRNHRDSVIIRYHPYDWGLNRLV